MDNLIVIFRGYILFASVFGYLLGQLFFGIFDVTFTIVGLSGIAIGILANKGALKSKNLIYGITVLGLICLLVVGVDAFQYYSNDHVPGNDYGWFLAGPFCVAIVFILSWLQFKASNKSLERDG